MNYLAHLRVNNFAVQISSPVSDCPLALQNTVLRRFTKKSAHGLSMSNPESPSNPSSEPSSPSFLTYLSVSHTFLNAQPPPSHSISQALRAPSVPSCSSPIAHVVQHLVLPLVLRYRCSPRRRMWGERSVCFQEIGWIRGWALCRL